jgi:N-acetyl-anhydromuramyl-L-alanine amidase AmpD
VEESNAGYKWNWDEKSLVHKYIGVTLQEEEYRKNDGSIGVKLVVKDIKTIEQIMKGEFKVPQIKKLAENNAPTYNAYATPRFEDVTNDDILPF